MNQNQINTNLEQTFNISNQANEELVDMLQDKERTFVSAKDLFLTVGDVQTILTLDNLE